jgi:uncharacterized protein (TIGR02757 family)
MNRDNLKNLLEELHDRYNNASFIESDPVSIPHSFSRREDIEISGFLVSTIAWGNRKAIISNGHRLMERLDRDPYAFVMNASEREIAGLSGFVHRTFNSDDLVVFIRALGDICGRHLSLGCYFESLYARSRDMRVVLSDFRREFFSSEHPGRSEKHISSIDKGSACKRLNMYLRWMVRHDDRGVDFGLWKSIPPSALYIPLDVHAGNMARALGLLARRQNDWKAVEEVTLSLRDFDSDDPVRYDYSLFGAGVDGYLKSNIRLDRSSETNSFTCSKLAE